MSNRGIPLALVWVPQEGISHRLPSDLLRGVWPERQLAVCALKRAVWESCRMRQWPVLQAQVSRAQIMIGTSMLLFNERF